MFGFFQCDAAILARNATDPSLFFVRTLVKNWLWPIITCFGVTGNILAIIVLAKRRMIMSSTNNYLAALALVDIAYLILTLILNTSQHPCFNGTTLAEILSTVCRPIADFSSNTSVWLTVTFTVERWVAITYPLQSRTWCTISRARKIIIGVMCAALICTSPSAFEMKLERVVEMRNSTEPNQPPSFVTHIRARPTALGSSELYHQIYFNFVTFAIIWIPLLLLAIFNTILIHYVRRSKQNDHRNSEGIQLRRHNHGNQGEQRKTTIMLIAVVLVFTVCQIPQAISLTVQSFFPVLSQTPKVLIYNNFANCLVAMNASTNFLLYCCFSDRFRSTFSSNFAFITKYCKPCIVAKWRFSTSVNRAHSISIDNMSFNYGCNPSTSSAHVHGSNTHLSNASNDSTTKPLRKSQNHVTQRQSEISNLSLPSRTPTLSKLKKIKYDHYDPKQVSFEQPDETYSNSLNQDVPRVASCVLKQSSPSNILTSADVSLRSSLDKRKSLRSSTVSCNEKKSPQNQYLSSMNKLHQPVYINCSTERLKRTRNTDSNCSQRPFTYHSQQAVNENSKEQVWIKRHLSNSTMERIFDRPKSFLFKEIIDATV